ncbi:MAG: hypothetical protein GXP52_05500 [Deltaproteobacteria bacterium]|nr:hypothetical protein [Deltaproteobacteria bacterium]
MPKMRFETWILRLAVLGAFLAAGCSATLPPAYQLRGFTGEAPSGKILALAADGSRVVAASAEGLYEKEGRGPWHIIPVPGIRNKKSVSSLAVNGGEIFVGTRGEGLHILSNGIWEVKTSKYGGLPDDDVLSLGIDHDGEGLDGENVWVGTSRGLALRRNGNWELYSPKDRWLGDLAGRRLKGNGDIYVASGFRLGLPGEEKKSFRPPITSIAVGKDRVVLASKQFKLAIISDGVFATVALDRDYFHRSGENVQIESILVEPSVIWCGTSMGLIWGGLDGVARGVPYPSWIGFVPARATLFNSRDTRPFQYRWHLVGYNAAEVKGLIRDSDDGLWVAFSGSPPSIISKLNFRGTTGAETGAGSITAIRRYIHIDEYIAGRRKPYYEVYGNNVGISGSPTTLAFGGPDGGVWLGTKAGVFNLGK